MLQTESRRGCAGDVAFCVSLLNRSCPLDRTWLHYPALSRDLCFARLADGQRHTQPGTSRFHRCRLDDGSLPAASFAIRSNRTRIEKSDSTHTTRRADAGWNTGSHRHVHDVLLLLISSRDFTRRFFPGWPEGKMICMRRCDSLNPLPQAPLP